MYSVYKSSSVLRQAMRLVVAFLAVVLFLMGNFSYAQTSLPDLTLEEVALNGSSVVTYRNDGTAISGQPYSITFQWITTTGTPQTRWTLSRNAIAARGRDIITWDTMVEGIINTTRQECYGGALSKTKVCYAIPITQKVTQPLAAVRVARPQSSALLAVTLDDGNNIKESNEVNNYARVGDAGFRGPLPAPLPELMITRSTFDGTNLFVVFQNQSATKISNQPFDVGLQWLDKNKSAVGDRRFLRFKNLASGGVEVIDSRTGIATLSQNGPSLNDVTTAETLSVYLSGRPDTATKLRVMVDERNQILETIKANNVATLEVPPILLPDLTITKQILNSQQLSFSYGNIGQAPLVGSPTFSLWFEWVDDKGTRIGNHLYQQERDVRSIPQGTTIPFISKSMNVTSARGTFTIEQMLKNPPPEATSLKITIDGSNTFREINEENNTVLLKKSVVPLPDLVFGPVARDGNSLRVEVQNKGGIPSAPPDLMLEWLAPTGSVAGPIPAYATALILPNSSYVFTLALNGPSLAERFLASPPPAATKLQLAIDGSRRIAEINEDNNTTTIDRSVLKAPEVPSRLTLALIFTVIRSASNSDPINPAAPEAHPKDTIRVGLRAINIGTAPATGITLWLPCPQGTTWKNSVINDRPIASDAGQGVEVSDLALAGLHRLDVSCTVEESALAEKSVRFIGSALVKQDDRRFNSEPKEIKVSPRPGTMDKPDLITDILGVFPKENTAHSNPPFEARFVATI